jgi:hypothetical protein
MTRNTQHSFLPLRTPQTILLSVDHDITVNWMWATSRMGPSNGSKTRGRRLGQTQIPTLQAGKNTAASSVPSRRTARLNNLQTRQDEDRTINTAS